MQKYRPPMLPGVIVRVRPWNEIVQTLDEGGMLEGLPFMPEMLAYCGKDFVVSRRLERTCEEIEGGMRRIQNVVFLADLRCDGTGHGDCQKGCMLFWKEAWLRELGPGEGKTPKGNDRVPVPYEAPCGFHDGQYICQSTELLQATSRLPLWDIRTYFRDVRARTYSVWKLTRILSFALRLRLRRLLTGRSYRVVSGTLNTTPTEALNLRPGEWVVVKSKQEITATLDRNGKNQGLAFTIEMVQFCGKPFRVLRRLERMVLEPTRALIDMKNTVILEGVTCDGCHILRGGCPRENFHFWREIWLRRLPVSGAHGNGNARLAVKDLSRTRLRIQKAGALRSNKTS